MFFTCAVLYALNWLKSTQSIISLKSLYKTIHSISLMFSIGCCLIYGCAPVQSLTAPPPGTTPYVAHQAQPDVSKILTLLHEQVDAWAGVPYRLGGLSKEGVDCSGFVYMTYLTQLNTRLPRSTYQQSQIGDYVFQNDLRAGDLVFFRIGYSTRHVGIYLENGLFAHASKSSGVMRSHLQDDYWSKRYWKAIRIEIDMP